MSALLLGASVLVAGGAIAQQQIPLPKQKPPEGGATPPAPAPPSSTTDSPPVSPAPAVRPGPRPRIVAPGLRAAVGPGAQRLTHATPDAMASAALGRARGKGASALASMLVAVELDERAAFGLVRQGLSAIGASNLELSDDARWLRLMLTPAALGPAWPGYRSATWEAGVSPSGIARAFRIVGPFEDTGGGLARREGPESTNDGWLDAAADYSWGAYEVRQRRVLPQTVSPLGIPLDLYIHPRTETCTYLATKVTLSGGGDDAVKPVRLHLGATGAVRVAWDGTELATSEEVHSRMVLDRIAVDVDATPGPHLVSIKVCSSAVGDEGRVRLRFTDRNRKPVRVESSSDLAGVTTKVPRFARVQTPLEKAIAVSDAPGVEEALAAGIVRTLAGADDTRATRAPGLLERVAADPAVTPDTLAMAGWVSPFGANRSGWLNRARERAKAAGDTATESFAQRRLAASQISAGMVDWALATIDAEPLRSATDAEARLLRSIARGRLGSAGLSRGAYEELTAIERDLKHRTPLSVRREIIAHTGALPDVQLRQMERVASMAADARGPDFVAAYRKGGAAAVERMASRALLHQTDAESLASIGDELMALGRHEWAREYYFTATQLSPNLAIAFQGLGSARQMVLSRETRHGETPSEDPALATLALRRAIDLQPGEARAKAELAFRTEPLDPDASRKTVQGGLRGLSDEKHIVLPAVFLERAKKDPAKVGEVADRQLHWVRAVTYHPDRRVSQMMHYAREIVIEPRTQYDLDERDVPAEGDESELIIARVHKKDGSVLGPEEQAVGGPRPYIRWPKLERGDVVEVAVRSWTSQPVGRRGDAPYYFIDYVGSVETRPVLYNEVVVDLPKQSPFAIDVLNGKPDRTEREERDGRVIERLIWESPPTIPEEPLSPRLTETLPLVVGSTYAGWDEFRKWYRGAVAGFTEPDDQVRRLAKELTAGKASRQEKIEALHDFVADDIRYVNYVSGEWWLPNRPQQLLARRQGDCDDKAMLLISLLSVIGVEATPVLVQTRYTAMPSLLSSEKVAVPVFDHGIAFIPGEGGKPGQWLDATSPQSRIGPLPAMDARARAFFVEEGEAKIIETPPSSPEEHGVEADWRITLTPTGAGDLQARESHSGDSAFFLRNNLREPDARAQFVEQYLAGGLLSTVEVKPGIDFDGDLPGGRASLRFSATSEGLARKEGGELAVPISQNATLTSQLAPLKKRTLPVVLPPSVAPGHRNRTITITAPAGFTFADLPPGGEEKGGAFGAAKLTFRRKGNEVVVEQRVTFDMSTIPVARYDEWRGWLQRVDGMMHRVVRLVPAK